MTLNQAEKERKTVMNEEEQPFLKIPYITEMNFAENHSHSQ